MKKIVVFMLMVATSFLVSATSVSAASIKVTSPKDGDVWEIGKTYTIKWEASSSIKKVGIFIYNRKVAGSGSTNYITPNGEKIKASDGKYDWFIQANQLPKYSESDRKNFDIIIYGYNNNGKQVSFSESKSKFTIIPAVAVTTSESVASITEKKEQPSSMQTQEEELRSKFKEKFTKEKCVKIQGRVNERVVYFDEKASRHSTTYTNIEDHVNKLISVFNEAGIDASIIKIHLVELQTKISKFKKDYATYNFDLRELENVNCAYSEGEFRGSLLKVKNSLTVVHTDAADIRTFVRETILADIKALKAQMPKEEDSTINN